MNERRNLEAPDHLGAPRPSLLSEEARRELDRDRFSSPYAFGGYFAAGLFLTSLVLLIAVLL
jgi:hypothetical protein